MITINKIIINKKQLLFERKLITLDVDKSIKPNFADTIRFPLRSAYMNNSKGKVLANFIYNKKKYPAIIKNNKEIILNFDPEETINYILEESYIRKTRPIHSYSPIHYHKIPFRILLTKLKYFSKKQKPEFPAWPIESSIESIRYIVSRLKNQKQKPLWPNNKKFAVALTHDVDTLEGFKSINQFMEIEKRYNMRSTWYIVSNYYPLAKSTLNNLKEQGHEIGWHGYNHDNKIAYLKKESIKKRIKKSMLFFKQNNVKGFRSPSLLTTPILEKEISKILLYDSSTVDTDPFLADNPSRGCCSVFPFHKNNQLIIPITVPMDASLICAGFSSEEIYNLWIKKIDWIKSIGGVAVITTHTEKHYSANKQMLTIYEKLLKHLSKEDAWIVTMAEIAEWWKKR